MNESPESFDRTTMAVRAAAVVALAVPFVVNLDAQWLKVDDFAMIELFRGAPLRRLVPDILLTRTTPYVRFAFLEHLLFIPFYREAAFHRAAVNGLFLGAVAALIWVGLALARPLRREAFAWLGAWVVYAAAIVHPRGWNTLELKTGLYLPLGFALIAATVAYTRALLDGPSPASRGRVAAWALLAVASIHMSEVSLFAVIVAGAALVLGRRAAPWVPGAVTLWPLAYWGLNKLLVPRVLGPEMSRRDGVLLPALAETASHAAGTFRVESALCVVLLAIALGLTVAKARPGSAPALLLAAALPASGLGMLVLAQMNSVGAGVPGYLSDRHAFFAQLCLVGGAVAAATIALRLGGGLARWALPVALLLVGGIQLGERLPALFAYTDARRVELERTFAVREALEKRAGTLQGSQRELLVFVTEWPCATVDGVLVDATFMGPLARDAFAAQFVCRDAGCPRVTFLPNAGWYRTSMDERQRSELCRRLERADALIVGKGGMLSPVPAAQPASACASRVAELGLVDRAEPPPR